MKLIAVLGPTACRKSETALFLGERFNGEILSADSVSVYRGFDIGSAKPELAERSRIPHHLIDVTDCEDRSFSVSRFRELADKAIEDMEARGKRPILVGGSGLYADAVLEDMGYAVPSDKALRSVLEEEYDKDPPQFFEKLREADPLTANRLHPNDKKRVVRALEVYTLLKTPLSKINLSYEEAQKKSRYDAIRVGLTMEREKLYARINGRVDAMLKKGLLEEARGIYNKGYDRSLPAMQSIGYAQLFDYFDGKLSYEEAVEAIKRDTRRFAKRQLTWFKRDGRIRWFNCADFEACKKAVEAYIKEGLRIENNE